VIRMACRGICTKYKVLKPKSGGHYQLGHKRCQICEIFIEINDLTCPCCGCKLRTKSRTSTGRKTKDNKRIITIIGINGN